MAANTTLEQRITFTLTGTTADTVSIAGNKGGGARIINHGSTAAWVRADGVVAVAGAAGAMLVPPNYGAITIPINSTQLISVVGATPGGNMITVTGVSAASAAP